MVSVLAGKMHFSRLRTPIWLLIFFTMESIWCPYLMTLSTNRLAHRSRMFYHYVCMWICVWISSNQGHIHVYYLIWSPSKAFSRHNLIKYDCTDWAGSTNYMPQGSPHAHPYAHAINSIHNMSIDLWVTSCQGFTVHTKAFQCVITNILINYNFMYLAFLCDILIHNILFSYNVRYHI